MWKLTTGERLQRKRLFLVIIFVQRQPGCRAAAAGSMQVQIYNNNKNKKILVIELIVTFLCLFLCGMCGYFVFCVGSYEQLLHFLISLLLFFSGCTSNCLSGTIKIYLTGLGS